MTSGIGEFAQYDTTSLVSREILKVFTHGLLDDSYSSTTTLPLLKRRITQLEGISTEIQLLFKKQLEDKLSSISTICKCNSTTQHFSSAPQLFYLSFLQKLNNAANSFAEYQSIQAYISNAELVNHISNGSSAYGFNLAMQYKHNDGVLGQKSRERITFEFNNFICKQDEICKYLTEYHNSKLNAELSYIFVQKNGSWVVTNNAKRLNQFIASCLLSSMDYAIAKRIDIAIKPYLYDKIQITTLENPLKNITISASQSLLALCRSLTFLTDLHLQIKNLDTYILNCESYVSNRLMKWLNSLIISLTWDTKGMYDIVHMGLLTFYFVQLRSFLLPELASTVKHILGGILVIVNIGDGGNSHEEWRNKLRVGSEYQVNPYKGWIPGKPFKGIHIPLTATALELSNIAISLMQLFDSVD
ncbi:hypothetical protein BmR1_04g09910 [Babesia microti strain RI]|uniref:Uncharacterized protein n=1 Tax=Babesia microti (strain RI) TaxID=1133968 RepID=I7IHP0_BABMR|nr:hypothetical protein BmR1_04g09910 [Babesia microti strain RI]CCF76147.1 hypothetical protein BmR1_04g09910 [Babesia microti strain RI]|eukprot:XP_012650555.1 hypothetical protein BmR1_04g09910 [Babesia microti strain RI]